ncbi:hypothetical protein SADUNF_Sadunf15G0098300 [Salix dunnii]|uniref:Uncharacterized protein n=1 Tax=Salix dunnii TaxID=1413687 RepID=A0A835JG78_9ROSI|nr:hypothetical protein SADUNF_Sadunf15G0098300 [Salix dunnii]
MSEQQEQPALATGGSNKANDKSETAMETEPSVPKFIDERWTKGSWDLNMFVKDGKMDWDGLNEAGEYTLLHLKCENHQAFALYSLVLQKQKGEKFLNCIQIHLQMKNLCSLGAPLYLGRAAMVVFFAAYIVDELIWLARQETSFAKPYFSRLSLA